MVTKPENTWRKNAVKYEERNRRTQLENTIGANFIKSSNMEKYISIVEHFKDRNV
jgi:hypothetical protein